jgi:hypothetical protein
VDKLNLDKCPFCGIECEYYTKAEKNNEIFTEMLEALIESTKCLKEDQEMCGISADRFNQSQIDKNIIIIEKATGLKIEEVIGENETC